MLQNTYRYFGVGSIVALRIPEKVDLVEWSDWISNKLARSTRAWPLRDGTHFYRDGDGRIVRGHTRHFPPMPVQTITGPSIR